MANYLQEEVLSSTINPYYFLWAPLKTALFNFKIAYSKEKTPIEQKIETKALETLAEEQREEGKAFLFFLNRHVVFHAAVGILLIIPGINLFPFCYLVIKAKEGLLPEIFQKEIVKEKEKNKEEVEQKKTIQVETKNLVTITTRKKTEPIPIEKPVQNQVDPFGYLKRDNNFSQSLVERHSPSSYSFLSHKEGVQLEESIVTEYLTLFPDTKMEEELKKTTDHSHFTPDLEEKTIVEKLLLRFPGHTLEPKLHNAEHNIDTLKKRLIQLFGKERGIYPIQEQFSHDLFVPTAENPSEHLRVSLFSYDQEAFERLLDQLEFELFHDVIHVKNKSYES